MTMTTNVSRDSGLAPVAADQRHAANQAPGCNGCQVISVEVACSAGIRRILWTLGFIAAALGMSSMAPAQGAGVKGVSTDAHAAQGAQCRIQYRGPQPDFPPPPSYVVDAPLPSMFCEQTGEWVFIYETAAGIQFYTLDPGKRESYRDIFRDAARGDMAPWVFRTVVSGRPAYFVNANPASDDKFDYALAPENFQVCAELAARPRISTVEMSGLNECGAREDDNHALDRIGRR